MKKYIIFDLDWTLIQSMENAVKIILDYLKNIKETDLEKAKYVFKTTPWMALKNQVKLIYNDEENIDYEKIVEEIYNNLLNYDADFFNWVPEKIMELKEKYKLFLTTWNSTQVAIKHLSKWKILECFELVYWSDKVLKWMDHLNIFKEYSDDKDFFKNSVYVWDWQSDRIFAKQAWIDFIHIWNEKIDEYEINSVVEIDKILDIF